MKKNNGVRKQIDELGRIVVPSNIRKQVNINEKDFIDISFEDDKIVMQKVMFEDKFKKIKEKIGDPIYNRFQNEVVITDKKNILYAMGNNVKKCIGQPISKELLEKLNDDHLSTVRSGYIKLTNDYEVRSSYFYLAIQENWSNIGSIIIIQRKNNFSQELCSFIFDIIN